MRAEDAPPGFWQLPGDAPALIDGVELESRVPTRFFQTVDAYPPEWGRLIWRVQLNKIVAGRAEAPVFRTFYPGVEWKLNLPDYRWFLTAWFKWDGSGPESREPSVAGVLKVTEDTAVFPIPRAQLFLRSRIDARDRRRIAEALRTPPEPAPKSDPALILLDDIIKPSQ